MTLNVVQFMRRARPGMFSIERLYQDVRDSNSSDILIKTWTCRRYSAGIRPRLLDMIEARYHQGDINHVTGDTHFLAILMSRRRTVLTIHDMVSLHRLRGVKRFLLWLFWYWLPVQRSRAIVVISERTKEELLASVQCDRSKIHVIHNCVSDEFAPSPRVFEMACPRILQVGTRDNKNLLRVIPALQGIRCKLVIIGPLTEKHINLLNENAIDYENLVGLDRKSLLQQYVGADIVLFASTYEGFGMPVVEAQAVGRPIITSNIAPMTEIAGDAAYFVDPMSIDSIRSGVIRVIGDEELRSSLVHDGLLNARRFRAAVVARRYLDLYRSVASLV